MRWLWFIIMMKNDMIKNFFVLIILFFVILMYTMVVYIQLHPEQYASKNDKGEIIWVLKSKR